MSDDYTDHDAPPEEPKDEPRWDLVTEQSVLGAMLISKTAVDDVMDELRPGDFYDPRHELIARAIGALVSKNMPVDPLTVVEELRATEKLRQAGDAHYIHYVHGVPPTAANAGYYAQTVKSLAVKRRLTQAGMRIQAMGSASEGEVEELVDQARSEVEGILVGKRRQLHPVGDTLLELVEELNTKPTFTPSPWESLDKLIGGFAPGNLIVFAARPGSGKSIAALQVAAGMAHYGMVAFCSLEMTEKELQKRLLAQYGPVHMTALRNHSLNEDDWKRVAEAKTRVQGAPIFIDDEAGVTLAHIRSHARSVQRRGKLVMIVVDYLQLVKAEGNSRQEEVAEVAQGLKNLAKDFQVPVLAAAQLRRAGDQRGPKRLPTLDDLRESGAIEQAADVVVLMDRPDKEKKPNDLVMVVGKNRHGDAGKFTLAWEAQFARLRDRSWNPQPYLDGAEAS